ncbi:MAG: hypothetical protein ACLTDP_00005 [Terrisporobacter sp.]
MSVIPGKIIYEIKKAQRRTAREYKSAETRKYMKPIVDGNIYLTDIRLNFGG